MLSGRARAQIRLDDPGKYQSIVDAEWEIIYRKLRNCADSGAKIVLSRLAIGDLGTQFFADRDIFCAGRVRLRLRAPLQPHRQCLQRRETVVELRVLRVLHRHMLCHTRR